MLEGLAGLVGIWKQAKADSKRARKDAGEECNVLRGMISRSSKLVRQLRQSEEYKKKTVNK